MTNSAVAHAASIPIEKQPHLDISNEGWREYVYPDGSKVRVEGAVTLILDRRPDGDRHRLIVLEGGKEVGVYITPGWRAIRWQTPDGKHGITF